MYREVKHHRGEFSRFSRDIIVLVPTGVPCVIVGDNFTHLADSNAFFSESFHPHLACFHDDLHRTDSSLMKKKCRVSRLKRNDSTRSSVFVFLFSTVRSNVRKDEVKRCIGYTFKQNSF